MRKEKRAVFIGRFQPFHYGHLEALRETLKHYNCVTVVIGSSDQNFSCANPLTISERLVLVRKAVEHEKWEKKVQHILPFPDISDNVVWTRSLADFLPPFDAVVTNNQLVADLFRHIGIPVKPLVMKNRDNWQGAVIRKAVANRKEWKSSVPAYLLPSLDRIGIEERILHAHISL